MSTDYIRQFAGAVCVTITKMPPVIESPYEGNSA
jgi:hypothetical protein